MNQVIKNLTSLRHLIKTHNTIGQVATLLILAMVIMLIFVLATVQIGRLSVQTTQLSNAADTGALQIASNCATKARDLYEGMGSEIKKCVKAPVWTIILAAVLAVIVVVASIFCPGLGIGAGPYAVAFIAGLAGAVGGAAGAAMDGNSIGNGFLTGFMIGAAIGMMNPEFAAEGAIGAGTNTMSAFLSTGEEITFAAGEVLATLSLASSVAYGPSSNEYNTVADNMKALQQGLSKLDERDQFREGAFLTVLSQVVDDPNTVVDANDMNGNGNTVEQVSAFQNWFYNRILKLDQAKALRLPAVESFISQMKQFRDAIANTYQNNGCLQRKDYKWDFSSGSTGVAVPGDSDGAIPYFTRALDGFGYPLGNWTNPDLTSNNSGPFWASGPTPDKMNQWFYTDTDIHSNPPAGYDWLDDLADKLVERVAIIDTITASDSPESSFPNWVNYFYDQANPDDPTSSYYAELDSYIKMLDALEARLMAIASAVPKCDLGTYTADPASPTGQTCSTCIAGAPCHWVWRYGWFYCISCGDCVKTPPGWPCQITGGGITLTEDGNDDLEPALVGIMQLAGTCATFRQAIKNLEDNLASAYASLDAAYGGYPNVTYSWTDARGQTTVSAETDNTFPIPYIRSYKEDWRTSCSEITDYQDQGRCWIKVSRTDPSGNVGPLGRWNPFATASKKAWASYNIQTPGSDVNVVKITKTQ